jgi:hypothetical protein
MGLHQYREEQASSNNLQDASNRQKRILFLESGNGALPDAVAAGQLAWQNHVLFNHPPQILFTMFGFCTLLGLSN